MIQPAYIQSAELLALGITSNEVSDAASVINSALGANWIQKQQLIHERNPKYSMAHIFNRHPLFDWLRSASIESITRVLYLAECLCEFSEEKSMRNFLARLRDIRNVKQAIFEIVIAKGGS